MVGVLLGVLALAAVVCGCVCVVWSHWGGPRWVRGVAAATLAVGELLGGSEKSRRRNANRNGDDGD